MPPVRRVGGCVREIETDEKAADSGDMIKPRTGMHPIPRPLFASLCTKCPKYLWTFSVEYGKFVLKR